MIKYINILEIITKYAYTIKPIKALKKLQRRCVRTQTHNKQTVSILSTTNKHFSEKIVYTNKQTVSSKTYWVWTASKNYTTEGQDAIIKTVCGNCSILIIDTKIMFAKKVSHSFLQNCNPVISTGRWVLSPILCIATASRCSHLYQ